jgi:pyruvate/2-oxoglutarate dehydrogenase complex dihydrolipoamide acyltransferase (E2) component
MSPNPSGNVSTEPLDYADRWLRDSLAILHPSFTGYQITVDMTKALAALDGLRREGVLATPTYLVIRAAARALAANPALHQQVVGSRRYRFGRADIGLSVGGETFVAPVLVIEGAERKTIAEIAEEVARRTPLVRQADAKALEGMRRWGRLVPFAFLRRLILRRMFGRAAFRRKVAGTFQVTTVPTDWAVTSAFVATGVLVAGQVSSRVVAVDGQPAVRPTMVVTLSGDHGVWDGRAAARFLAAFKAEMESDSPR